MNEFLILIATANGVDEYGDPKVTETRREVFCREASIGQKEFYQAHANGLKPEIKLVLSDYLDYNGEQLVEYTPKGQSIPQRYRVLRTYRSGLELELVVYREVNTA